MFQTSLANAVKLYDVDQDKNIFLQKVNNPTHFFLLHIKKMKISENIKQNFLIDLFINIDNLLADINHINHIINTIV